MFLEGSVLYHFDNRITVLEEREYSIILSRIENVENDITYIGDEISNLVSRCGTIEGDIITQGGRIASLEAWKATMPKRYDRYTGTTDSNGDLQINFPTGRYATAPSIYISYIFNNDNHGTFYNIKFLTKDTILVRVMRNKNSAVLIGGNIDPDEPIPSLPVVFVATEYA